MTTLTTLTTVPTMAPMTVPTMAPMTTQVETGMGITPEDDSPSKYVVSTITCNATLNTSINLQIFFTNVNIKNDGFIWVEIMDKKEGGIGRQTRGVYPKKKKINEKGKQSFDNQVTMYYYFRDNYSPNIKLFKNGNIQMTGIKTYEDGVKIVTIIGDEVKRISESGFEIVADINNIKPDSFIIRMINSDFGLPFKIRRKNLHHLLISNTYNNACSFQPLTYPGVKLQFFWNIMNPQNNGVCNCTKTCYGKGKGSGNGDCKKVTVSIFDSGKILITGANAFDQVDNAYKYICKVIAENKLELKKPKI